MAYSVEFAARAARDVEILYLEKNAAPAAARRFNGWSRLSTRSKYINRYPVAPGARKVKRKLRHLLYGTKPHVYRVIYEVDERGQKVWVLTIRHAARKQLKPSDLL
jgi:mRNA-degrading endonuclease RelE of RelBE toxin-antitoxin system